MVKGVIFDFWGTLVENGVYPSPIRQVQRILRIDMPFQEYIVRFEKSFMLNKPDSLTKGFEGVCKEFGVRYAPWQIEKLVGLWNKNRLFARPYPETIEVLDELKKHYKIALLSNTDGFSVEPILEKYDLEKYFNNISLSYKVGMLKTDSAVFAHILKELKLKKEDVVMVGDSIESDVLAAESAGIKGILLDRRDRRIYPEKIKDLTEINGLL